MFFMARTRIAPEKTAAEIQALLGKKGARRILMEYEGGEVVAISFTVRTGAQEIPFRLPVRWEACQKAMFKDPETPRYLCSQKQAKMTAWRVILRWVQAQMALIDTEMVGMIEVMLPYAQMGEKTLYETIAARGFKLLSDSGGKSQ